MRATSQHSRIIPQCTRKLARAKNAKPHQMRRWNTGQQEKGRIRKVRRDDKRLDTRKREKRKRGGEKTASTKIIRGIGNADTKQRTEMRWTTAKEKTY